MRKIKKAKLINILKFMQDGGYDISIAGTVRPMENSAAHGTFFGNYDVFDALKERGWIEPAPYSSFKWIVSDVGRATIQTNAAPRAE